jgi:hypothetical protein
MNYENEIWDQQKSHTKNMNINVLFSYKAKNREKQNVVENGAEIVSKKCKPD